MYHPKSIPDQSFHLRELEANLRTSRSGWKLRNKRIWDRKEERMRERGRGKGHSIGWESKAPRTTDYNSNNTPQPARDC